MKQKVNIYLVDDYNTETYSFNSVIYLRLQLFFVLNKTPPKHFCFKIGINIWNFFSTPDGL